MKSANRGWSRRGVARRALLARLALAALLPLAASVAGVPRSLHLTVLHTNDLHGHLLPFDQENPALWRGEARGVGGAARRATLIRRLRASARNPVVVIDAGDVFTRGPLAIRYRGLADIEALNATGYDLACIGNNEFKARDAIEQNDASGAQSDLLQVVKRSRFPWLCANVTDERGALLEGVQPYVVREFDGVRVGFLGLTAPRSAGYPQTRGLRFAGPVESARTWVPRARAFCDVLIAVTHIGVELDRALAASVPGIDAIVGGDSHTILTAPLVVTSPDGRTVPIVQAGEFGAALGRLDLHFERGADGWRLASHRGELLPVTARLPADRAVERALAPYLRPTLVPAGRLESVGTTRDERMAATTRALVEALRHGTTADVAMNPAGAGMFEPFPGERVTVYDVYAAMPFRNRVVVADLTAGELARLVAAKPGPTSPPTLPAFPADRAVRVALVDYVAVSAYGLPAERLRDTGVEVQEATLRWLASRSAAPAARSPVAPRWAVRAGVRP